MVTIYDVILNDHEKHRDLLNKIAATEGASDDRKKFWDEFYYDVKAHAAAEEETLYSKLIATTAGQDHARHSVHEHQEMDDIMEELNGMDMSSTGWLTRFKTLKHEYEHHMEEEENEIFEKAKAEVSKDESGGIGAQFKARKDHERGLVDKKAKESLEE